MIAFVPIVTVIIPYYQSQTGILTRALTSVLSQNLPDGWSVEAIVVDDSSPCPAQCEVDALTFNSRVNLRVVRQNNGGVAAARNKGLDEARLSSTLIAFLDSDDIWPSNHLLRAIDAHIKGYEFYFTDNRRVGFHNSHVHSDSLPETRRLLSIAYRENGLVEIPRDSMVGLILREFPTQASTVVYSRSVAPDLRFNRTLKTAAEDILFFTALAALSRRVAFDAESCVECGDGMNVYFGHLDWDNNKLLSIKLDQMLAHYLIRESVTLPSENRAWNERRLIHSRKEFIFHISRNLIKHPSRVPEVMLRLIRQRPLQAVTLPVEMLFAAISKLTRRNR